jgi:hypothetical protein
VVAGPLLVAENLPYLKREQISGWRRSCAEARAMTNFVKVARTDEIGPGQAKIVDVKGKQIALFNVGGSISRSTICTHEEASLAEEVSGNEVTCPARRGSTSGLEKSCPPAMTMCQLSRGIGRRRGS